SFTVRSAASVWRSGVCLILHSYLVKMSQKLSLMQSAQLIPWALTGNTQITKDLASKDLTNGDLANKDQGS
ncbi:MAG: hypothetical protein AAF234_12550, partial [Pseudomonadota bacterium]